MFFLFLLGYYFILLLSLIFLSMPCKIPKRLIGAARRHSSYCETMRRYEKSKRCVKLEEWEKMSLRTSIELGLEEEACGLKGR